ncbi:glycoside hydrolase family 30 beta sandwich domain-containing protein [Streptomyces sp. TS71-3]|uniref:glycoside hydrolase family 30 protein n=1 Tax=Streptomyces sp. TS71-3 TaxID=2733862 RepID=UPI001B2C1AAC|nr:glycoside hydrolase family 30 beta sandwich domain-containing protein [Streptomyces sp. TS71-3]GHJ37809.1 glucosylceramidase [Streptomyces sp. TS71-3]
MPPTPQGPASPTPPRLRAGLSRRAFLALTTAGAAAAGSALLLPDQAGAAARGTRASDAAQVTFSSESTADGFEPKSGAWYEDPATGLAGVAYALSKQDDIAFTPAGGGSGQVIGVDPGTAYQSVLGIGTSMEDSTVYALSLMSPDARTKALRALFDPASGAGFGITRICFGTSDFSQPAFYTYDDGAADPDLANFSIQKDIDNHVIATLKEALQINPDLVVFGTTWSAPAWMKDNNSLIGGHLLDEYVPAFAAYYRRTVQAYAEQGITVHAVTPQNEPLNAAKQYPSMLVSAEQEQRLLDAMHQEFADAGLATEIWGYDHNFGQAADYAAGLYGTPGAYSDAYRNSTAIALHDYSGDPSAMSGLKDDYPDLDVIMTERMVWGTEGADRIAQYLRNWSIGYVAWATMLDQNRQSQQFGTPDPTPLIQSPADRDSYWALPEYNFFAQYARFVQRGAKRIDSDYGDAGTVTTVAFLNPDGTVAVIVVNQTGADQDLTLRSEGRQLTATLPAKTVGTYVWQR